MKKKEKVARPERLELPTLWFEARCSIQLSYGRTRTLFTINSLPPFLLRFQSRVQLTPDECTEYHALGWTFLQYFAEKINYWSARYLQRRVSAKLQADAEATIERSK
jgi:hypothetical protein